MNHIDAWRRVGGDMLLVAPYVLSIVCLIGAGADDNSEYGEPISWGFIGLVSLIISHLISAGIIK